MLRVYLTGDVCVELGDSLVGGSRFPGMQGRVLFAMLAAAADDVRRDRILEELWGSSPPRAAGVAVRSLLSKIRAALAGLAPGAATIEHVGEAYRWVRPRRSWVDTRAAADAIHRAETALVAGNHDDAAGWGRVAATITGRPLLPGAVGPWVEETRREQERTLLRSLDCLAEVWLSVGAHGQAARDAERAASIDPFRESSRRIAMRAYAMGGDRAAALLTYESLRDLMARTLGADPSPETQQLHVAILRGAAVR